MMLKRVGVLLAALLVTAVGSASVGDVATTQPAAVVIPNSPSALISLAADLASWGEARKAQRVQVAAHLAANVLTDGVAARKLGLAGWSRLAGLLDDELTAESRSAWADRIRQLFAPDEPSLFALDQGHLRELVGLLEQLGRKNEGGELAWSWLKHHVGEGLAPASQAGVALLGMKAKLDKAEKDELLKNLDKAWEADNAAKPMSVFECGAIARAWFVAGNLKKTHEWVMRGYQNAIGTPEARAKADTSTLSAIGAQLSEFGLTGKGIGYVAFTEVMASLAREGKLQPAHLPFMWEPLGTPETRQIIRAELMDRQGNPRLLLSRILTEAYKFYAKEDMQPWLDYVAQKVLKTQDPDSKAIWLIVKGYIEKGNLRIRKNGEYGGPNKALAVAASPAVRLVAVTELAEEMRGTDTYRTAILGHRVAEDILESVKNQFSGRELATIIFLQQTIRNEISARQAQAAKDKAAHEIASRKGLLAYWGRMLKSAELRKNEKEAAEYRACIAKVEGELRQLGQ